MASWWTARSVRSVACAADGEELEQARRAAKRAHDPEARAGGLVLADLRAQGWRVTLRDAGPVLSPPLAGAGIAEERRRVRAQLLRQRQAQVDEPSVRAFVLRMEQSALHRGRLHSIFSLMRDGRALASALASSDGAAALERAVRPYVQIVRDGARCEHTGLLLRDVWRYFRLTWTSPYTTQPGRVVQALIRDGAAENHPVMGILLLSSAPSQIAARDHWIGWSPLAVLDACRRAPSDEFVTWVGEALARAGAAVRLDDLVAQGLVDLSDVMAGDAGAARRLRTAAADARVEHSRYGRAMSLKAAIALGDDAAWEARMCAPLFRAKRCEALAELMEIRRALASEPLSAARLSALVRTSDGARAVRRLARIDKASRMGASIAELAVCGAVEPYRALLGGKLASMLAVSAEVRRAWEERYGGSPSSIASAMAGREVFRSSELAVITTTALYGRSCSQYNRVRVPMAPCGGAGELRFELLGETQGWGSGQFGADTVDELGVLVARRRGGQRVESVFGDGVNPRLRKVRAGLEALQLDPERLLRHGSRRAVYGVELGPSARAWLRGAAGELRLADRGVDPQLATECVVRHWRERWLQGRILREGVLEQVATHTLDRPMRHGARVVLGDGADALQPAD